MESQNVQNLLSSSSDKFERRKRAKKTTPKKRNRSKKGGKRKRHTSKVWEDFSDYTDEETGLQRGRCKHCGRTYAADPNANDTSSMGRHAKVCEKNPANFKDQTNIFIKKDVDGKSGSVQQWKFDYDKIRKALIKMIIVDELSFSFVEKEGFKEFMECVCPLFDLPSRFTVSRDVADYYLEEKTKLQTFFNQSKQRISVTTDTWTSVQRINYMSLTAHFIDDDYILHKRIINFKPIFSHSGKDIGNSVMECLEEWKINNLCTVSVDNATPNSVAIDYIKDKSSNLISNGKYVHVRCMAHVMNIVVGEAFKDVDDSVLRIRNCVRYIRSSPARIAKFKQYAIDKNLNHKFSLILDCKTRWNSTYDMLERAEKFEAAFRLYDLKDPGLARDLENNVPTVEDWKRVRKLNKILAVFKETTVKISGSSYPIAHEFISEVLELDLELRQLQKDNDYKFRVMGGIMRDKFDKYWGEIEKMNLCLYFAAVLDPRMKMFFIRYVFKTIMEFSRDPKDKDDVAFDEKVKEKAKKEVEDKMALVFNEYKSMYEVPISNSNTQREGVVEEMGKGKTKNKFMAKFGEASGSIMTQAKSEFIKYLEDPREPLDDDFDILQWWKFNAGRYSILAKMAKDFLAIPITTVASESAFSTGGRVVSDSRSSLSPTIVEALICTQDWVRKSKHPITTNEDAVEKDDELGEDIYAKVQSISIGASSGTTNEAG